MTRNDTGSASRRELLRGLAAAGAVGVTATGVASADEHGTEYAIRWEEVAGGDDDDVATDAVPTGDGGALAVGWTASYGSGTADAWAVKVDGDGDREWDRRTYSGPNDDRGAAVAVAPGGGYLMAGSTTSFGDGTRSVWVGRTDAEGRLLTDRTLGAGSENTAAAIATDGAGYTVAYTADDTDGRTPHLARFDRADTLQWDRALEADSLERVTDARRTDTGYVLCGTSKASADDDPTGWVRTTDNGGYQRWRTAIGGSQTDRVRSVVPGVSGGYLAVGDSDPFGNRRSWVTAVAADGTVTWNTLLDGTGVRGAVAQSESYLLARTGADGSLVLEAIDEAGVVQWTQPLSGTQAIDATVFEETPDGYLLAGHLTAESDQLWVGGLTTAGFPGTSGPPASVDDDPLYEDVDGDGDADLFDALTYYEHRNSDRIQSNPRRYDFDGDGEAGDLFDTLALYEEIS